MHKSIVFLLGLPLVGGLFVWVIYGQGINAPFIFDDYLTIVENPAIKSLQNLPWIWQIDPSRFLTYLSFAVNFAWGGLNVGGYHIVSFALHAINGAMVFFFLKLMVPGLLPTSSKRDATLLAFMASLVFLCHPVQTQAVIYISERSTLFEVFFYLGSLISYLRSVEKNHRGYYSASLVLVFFGLFSKPNFITLPFAIVLCEGLLFGWTGSRLKKRLPYLLPFFLVLFLIPALLVLWKHKAFSFAHIWDVTRETSKYTRKEYLFTQFNVLITYIRLLIFPVNQNLDYHYPISKSLLSFPTYLSFTALIAANVYAIRAFKSNKIASFGIFWFVLTLSIESSIFPISDVIFEHRLYLPMIGPVLAALVIFKRFFKSENVFIAVTTAVITVLTIVSYQRVTVWNDRIGMLSDIALKSPGKPRVHNNLASALHDAGRFREAEREYREAIMLDAAYAHPHNNLSNIYLIRGETQKAIDELERAIAIDPEYEAPHYNLGNVYFQMEDYERAERCYRRALAIKPALALGYLGLGNVAIKKRDAAIAKNYFYKALNLDPNLGFAYYGLGDIYLSEGRYDLAFDAYRMAVEKNPKIVSAYNNIGNLLDMSGKKLEAANAYRMAINADPSYANAYFNLANTLKKMGRLEEAARYLATARELFRTQGNASMDDASRLRLQSLLR